MVCSCSSYQQKRLGRVSRKKTGSRRGDPFGKLIILLTVGLLATGWRGETLQATDFGPIADGDVSALIDAIEAANDEAVNPGPDRIILTAAGTYALSMTADPRIPFVREGNNGLPPISTTITIVGNESVIERDASLFIDPNNPCSTVNDEDKFRIFYVGTSATLMLSDLAIQNGCGDNFDGGFENVGGGIFVEEGVVTLNRGMVKGHTTTDDVAGGGGIGIFGIHARVTLLNSTVKDNVTTGQGAGIFNLGGTVNLTRSIVRDNLASRTGGGIASLGGLLTLNHSVVRGNEADSGGGIRNDRGQATLLNSVVEKNTAIGRGGGIQSIGTLTVQESLVSRNQATNGGGIDSTGEAAKVMLIASTVSENRATRQGGGLFNFLSPATLTLTNSTVSGNMAAEGGGLYTRIGPGFLTLTHSTVSDNTATSGGGIFVETVFLNGTVTLSNTILADQRVGQDCVDDGFTTFNSTDFNLDSDGTCHLNQSNDKPNGSANLGPLQINAPGTTATHALRIGSEAIDVGDCVGGAIIDDQRGVSRPQGEECDIGAFEVVETLVLACDINRDETVDRMDIGLIFAARNTLSAGPDDLRDQDKDGKITVSDGRLCALECTNPQCRPFIAP